MQICRFAVGLEFFSFDCDKVTEKDYQAAAAVDTIFDSAAIQMKQFSYCLPFDMIARYPSNPRGTSKLLHVDSEGHVKHFDHFAKYICDLGKGSHFVFNDSRVLDARIFVKDSVGGNDVEMMILNLGDFDEKANCNGKTLNVMIRKEHLSEGDSFTSDDVGSFEVVRVNG